MPKEKEVIKIKVTKKGYIYDVLRKEGDEVLLKDVECKKLKDTKTGKLLIYTAEEQFSPEWMEKI